MAARVARRELVGIVYAVAHRGYSPGSTVRSTRRSRRCARSPSKTC
jgi:hypothetical protein